MSGAAFPPQGASARLFRAATMPHCPAAWTVVVALPPLEPDLANLLRPGEVTAMITHRFGVAWPDADGELLAAEALRCGGVVALVFASLGEALDCKARIEGAPA